MSLFSTASPVLPDRMEPGNRLVYENDSHEVGKTGFEVTAVRKARHQFRKQVQAALSGNSYATGRQGPYFTWTRPGYYDFLHRLNPF